MEFQLNTVNQDNVSESDMLYDAIYPIIKYLIDRLNNSGNKETVKYDVNSNIYDDESGMMEALETR